LIPDVGTVLLIKNVIPAVLVKFVKPNSYGIELAQKDRNRAAIGNIKIELSDSQWNALDKYDWRYFHSSPLRWIAIDNDNNIYNILEVKIDELLLT